MASWQKVLNMVGPEGPAASSGHSGTFTANGTTSVLVLDSNVLSTSTIIITRNNTTDDILLTPPAFVCQITPGISFRIVNSVSDECSYNYRIF